MVSCLLCYVKKMGNIYKKYFPFLKGELLICYTDLYFSLLLNRRLTPNISAPR